MAQKYTLSSSSVSSDRLQNVDNAIVHLSDGTLVFLYFTGTTVVLAYTSDRALVSTIATMTGFNLPGTSQGLTVRRDGADNLFVIGPDSTTPSKLRVQAFTKGVGYTWTAQSALISATGINGTDSLLGLAAVWCNTGGGTGGKGHLVVFACLSSGVTSCVFCDAGAALAGTGALTTASSTSSGGFVGGVTSNTTGSNIDIDTDGFGSSQIFVVNMVNASTVHYMSYAVSSTGTFAGSPSVAGTFISGALSANTKLRVVRYTSAAWAVAYPSSGTANLFMVARYSTTALLTAGSQTGSLNSNSSTLAWDAFADPSTPNRIWLMGQAGSAVSYRIPVDLGSGVSFGTEVAGDTFSPWTGAGTPDFRAVKKPVGGIVDWQAFAETDSTPTYALLGDYTSFNTAPNAPTGLAPASGPVDRSVIQRLSWTFSDLDAGDSQSKFDLQWRHKGTADAWNVVSQTTPNNYYDVPASTFPAEDIEWQVRTYDQSATVGPYSALAYFTAADPATPPTITAPTSGGTVSQNPTNVTWSTAGQQGYQVRRVRDNAGVADTTTVYYDTGQITDTTTRTVSVPFETNNRWEWVQVRVQQGGLWSAWSSIRVNVSYTQPATATLVAAGNNTTGAITVTITNPTPSGGQPTVSYNDVYVRAVGDTSAGVRIATGVANNGTAVYWTPASGVAYQFLVRTYGSNSTSADSAWTG